MILDHDVTDWECRYQTLHPRQPREDNRHLAYSGEMPLTFGDPLDHLPLIPVGVRFASFKRRLNAKLAKYGIKAA